MAQYDPNVDQFELQRKQAAQQVGAATQNQKDAIARRFAAQGSLNSGAALKQGELIDQAGQENLQKANEGINVNQNQELQRQKEVTEGRDFAKSEREAGQNFSAGQADINRAYGTSERLSSQGFQAGLAKSAQDFSAQQGALARDLQSSQFDKQFGLSNLQFGEEQRVNSANLELQKQLAGQKDILERLFGNLGFGGLFSDNGSGGSSLGSTAGGIVGAGLGGPVGYKAGQSIGSRL